MTRKLVWAIQYYSYTGDDFKKPVRIIKITAPSKNVARDLAPKALPGEWRTIVCLGPA